MLYNTPRAASIVATSDCVLFSLDRKTFNHIGKRLKKLKIFEVFRLKTSYLPYFGLEIWFGSLKNGFMGFLKSAPFEFY